MPHPLLAAAFVVCGRPQSCLARDFIAVAKSAATRNVLAASTTGVASENSGASGLPRSTDQCKAYAKRESVLVVTVGTLDATAWLTATGTPDSPMRLTESHRWLLGGSDCVEKCKFPSHQRWHLLRCGRPYSPCASWVWVQN
jgi:hypothetical protein